MKLLMQKYINDKKTKYVIVDNYGNKQKVLVPIEFGTVERTIAYYETKNLYTTLVAVKLNSKLVKFNINDCRIL